MNFQDSEVKYSAYYNNDKTPKTSVSYTNYAQQPGTSSKVVRSIPYEEYKMRMQNSTTNQISSTTNRSNVLYIKANDRSGLYKTIQDGSSINKSNVSQSISNIDTSSIGQKTSQRIQYTTNYQNNRVAQTPYLTTGPSNTINYYINEHQPTPRYETRTHVQEPIIKPSVEAIKERYTADINSIVNKYQQRENKRDLKEEILSTPQAIKKNVLIDSCSSYSNRPTNTVIQETPKTNKSQDAAHYAKNLNINDDLKQELENLKKEAEESKTKINNQNEIIKNLNEKLNKNAVNIEKDEIQDILLSKVKNLELENSNIKLINLNQSEKVKEMEEISIQLKKQIEVSNSAIKQNLKEKEEVLNKLKKGEEEIETLKNSQNIELEELKSEIINLNKQLEEKEEMLKSEQEDLIFHAASPPKKDFG